MIVLVTGASGFIGHHLAERLLSGGHRVRCLARFPERMRDLKEKGAEILPGDVGSGQGLEEATRGVDAVAHLAGVVRAWRRETYFATNAGGTRLLARAAREAKVGRFLLVSSLAALGPGKAGGEVTEESEPRPINPYGESKLAAERDLAEVARDMPWVIVRPCAVYGPRERDVLSLFRMAAKGLVVYAAPRNATLSLIHATDLVDLILLALEKARPRSAYLASDGLAHSWREIIECIQRAVGRRGPILRIPPRLLWPLAILVEGLRPFLARPPILCIGKLREACGPCWVASAARARGELAWRTRICLEEGVSATAAWYRAEGWL